MKKNMKQILASLLALGSMTAAMWYVVRPDGVALCNSSTRWAVYKDADLASNVEMTNTAKAKFCAVVDTLLFY